MTRRRPRQVEYGAAPMDDYKEHLRRLAVHDDALLDALAVDGSSLRSLGHRREDRGTRARRRDDRRRRGPFSFQHAVALALAAGATSDEIVASLEAVTPGHRRRPSRPVRPEGRARARLRRRRGARAARPVSGARA